MKFLFRKIAMVIHPRFAVVMHDLLMVWLAWFSAHWIRLNLLPQPVMIASWNAEYVVVIVAQAIILWWSGLYRGLWRFASLPDLWSIAKACVIGVFAITLGLFLFNRLLNVPRWVLVAYPLLLFFYLGIPRLSYRYWKDNRLDLHRSTPAKRVLILGAGRAGETLARDLRRDMQYDVIGFLDDQRQLRGAKLHGIPVLGLFDDLFRVARETSAAMLLIAVPSANNQQMRRIVELCEKTELPFRTVPHFQDIMEGRYQFNQLKEVSIEDLLGREPVSLDWSAMHVSFSEKTVLVTGGGGSIGSELCRQLVRLGARAIAILEVSEFNLYRIEQSLRREFPQVTLHLFLGDCTDRVLCERALAEVRPHMVFHAAAYKHVPLLETQKREALRNNLLGTQSILYAANLYSVETFVLISTDKAVNPSNIMGATKRAAELLCQNFLSISGMKQITVRFGNVLDSAGSVVPLFREQIQQGGPVTVTHPEMTRYFMTIPEASQLIMQAAVMGQGGEIFVLDMGEPIQIRYLADQMIRLAGKIPDRDIKIQYTGLRPGEKLFEELFHAQEHYSNTRHSKIYLATAREVSWAILQDTLQKISATIIDGSEQELMALLQQIVPEYVQIVENKSM